MKNSHFKKDFYEETFRAFVDNLNLLYVSFTRAKYEIHSLSHLGGKEGEIKNTGDLLFEIIQNYSLHDNREFPEADLKSLMNNKTKHFQLGIAEAKESVVGPGDLIKTNILEEYPVNFNTKGLSLNHKNIYLSELKEDDPRRTGYGTQMHEILADIKTAGDTENALRKAWLKGLLDTEDKNKLSEKITSFLQNKPFSDWFSGNWKCKTESDLYNSHGKILRPDRVMISGKTAIVLDYKFGDERKSSYQGQVKEYGMALKEAGYEEIKLFLWYFNLEELVEVEL
jgi:hypothetical protein